MTMPTLTHYHWDPIDDCVLTETDQNANTTATYTHEPGQFGPLLSENRGGTESYHHYDALGSTTFLTNDAGTVTDTFTYDAWGNQVARAGTTATPYEWVGRWGYQSDAATGEFYVRARCYQPIVARWTSIDPLYAIIDKYAYIMVANAPTLVTDPSGMVCHGVCGVQAYYNNRIADLDTLVAEPAFSELADYAGFRVPDLTFMNGQNSNFGYGPPAFCGQHFFSNTIPFTLTFGTTFNRFPIVANGIKCGTYLFFVAFDVCEDQLGDCQLILNETGTSDTIYTSAGPPQVFDTEEDDANLTIRGSRSVSDVETRNPTCCNRKVIYVDSPTGCALLQGLGARKFWFLNSVFRTIKIRDIATRRIVDTFTHSVTIGVGPRREEIYLP